MVRLVPTSSAPPHSTPHSPLPSQHNTDRAPLCYQEFDHLGAPPGSKSRAAPGWLLHPCRVPLRSGRPAQMAGAPARLRSVLLLVLLLAVLLVLLLAILQALLPRGRGRQQGCSQSHRASPRGAPARPLHGRHSLRALSTNRSLLDPRRCPLPPLPASQFDKYLRSVFDPCGHSSY